LLVVCDVGVVFFGLKVVVYVVMFVGVWWINVFFVVLWSLGCYLVVFFLYGSGGNCEDLLLLVIELVLCGVVTMMIL